MIALGIDPGTRRVGYGIVDNNRNEAEFITAGLLAVTSKEDSGALGEIKKGIQDLIKKYKPDIIAVERLYFATNQKTAIAVAQARGVILLTIHESGTPLKEYTPNEVKSGITGYGFADKKAILKMVQMILKKPDLKIIDDASDALALAILAAQEKNLT
jgi:crossover junction endodeoxyribonuclease RuvC